MSKEKVKLIKRFEQCLDSLGLPTDEEGKVSVLEGGILVPFTIKGKRLVLPTEAWLKDPDWDNTIPFHPLSENTKRKKSEVFERLNLIVSNRLYQVGATLLCFLAELAADSDSHSKLTPEQRDFLRLVPEADKRTVDDIRKLARGKMGFKGDNAFVGIFIKRGGKLKGEEYPRLAVVTFPIASQEDNKDKRIFDVTFRVRDRDALFRILRWIFPHFNAVSDEYSFGSRSSVAPNFHALMSAYAKIAMELNKVTELFKDNFENIASETITLDWLPLLDDMDSYRNDIPPLDGNIGDPNEDELTRPRQVAENRERNRERKELRQEISSGKRSLLRRSDRDDERDEAPRSLIGRRDDDRRRRSYDDEDDYDDRRRGSRFRRDDRDRDDRDAPRSLIGRNRRTSRFGR